MLSQLLVTLRHRNDSDTIPLSTLPTTGLHIGRAIDSLIGKAQQQKHRTCLPALMFLLVLEGNAKILGEGGDLSS